MHVFLDLQVIADLGMGWLVAKLAMILSFLVLATLAF